MATMPLFLSKSAELTRFIPSKPSFLPPIDPIKNPRLPHHGLKHLIPGIPLPSSFRNGRNTPPETECPVPLDQQPINEYQTLSTSFPFSWASGDFFQYCSRLAVTGASFALFIGLPVAWFGAVGPDSEPLMKLLGAVSSGFFIATVAVVRMYLGWAYVGNRLLSATVECNFLSLASRIIRFSRFSHHSLLASFVFFFFFLRFAKEN